MLSIPISYTLNLSHGGAIDRLGPKTIGCGRSEDVSGYL